MGLSVQQVEQHFSDIVLHYSDDAAVEGKNPSELFVRRLTLEMKSLGGAPAGAPETESGG